jgi:hypothetical protein
MLCRIIYTTVFVTPGTADDYYKIHIYNYGSVTRYISNYSATINYVYADGNEG